MTSVLEQTQDLYIRIDKVTHGLSKGYFRKVLMEIADSDNPVNAGLICDYIISEQVDLNIKPATVEDKLKKLAWLSKFHSNKSFLQMTKQDILLYPSSIRKSHQDDPSQKWIGSFNNRQMIYLKFFKWLYHSDITTTFRLGLERIGYQVDVFNDPLEALSHFEPEFYDLLLLDVRMPQMNGFELFREIRKHDGNAKACFITAFEITKDEFEKVFPSSKVQCLIKKPVSIDDLVKIVSPEIDGSH